MAKLLLYALNRSLKMADEEAELDRSPEKGIGEAVLELREQLRKLEEVALKRSSESTIESSAIYCQEFCRVSCFLLSI